MSEKVRSKLIQIYPFHGTEVQDVYTQLNRFLEELAIIGVVLDLDQIRSNTKYYPDYDRTATTIEVCVFSDSLAPDNPTGQIRELHRSIIESQDDAPVDDSDNPVAEAYRLVRENGTRFVLDRNSEGYFLTDTSDQGTVFWGVSRDEVLARVQRSLGIQPATVPAADDFDPFLDSDDLP